MSRLEFGLCVRGLVFGICWVFKNWGRIITRFRSGSRNMGFLILDRHLHPPQCQVRVLAPLTTFLPGIGCCCSCLFRWRPTDSRPWVHGCLLIGGTWVFLSFVFNSTALSLCFIALNWSTKSRTSNLPTTNQHIPACVVSCCVHFWLHERMSRALRSSSLTLYSCRLFKAYMTTNIQDLMAVRSIWFSDSVHGSWSWSCDFVL